MRGLLAGLVLAALPLGCGSPDVGDIQEAEVSITLLAVASDPAVAQVGEPDGGLGVTRAFISASSFTLIPCLEDAAEVRLSHRGYELIGSEISGETVTTNVTELCGLRLDIEPVAANATEGVPEDAGSFLEGTDAAELPFELMSPTPTSLLLETVDGEPFGAGQLLLTFDLSIWLAGVPLETGMAETAVELLDAQIKDAALVYEDKNGNGFIDPDEEDPVARVEK